MSANLLQWPNSGHSYEDDLESFLYVMTWVSFTYMESKMTPQARFNVLKSMFEDDEGEDEHGNTLGGWRKDLALSWRGLSQAYLQGVQSRWAAQRIGGVVLLSLLYHRRTARRGGQGETTRPENFRQIQLCLPNLAW